MARMERTKELKLIRMVKDSYDASKNDTYRQYKEAVWDRCYKDWKGKLSKIIPRKSNLFIPETFKTVETMIAREMSAIFNESGILFKFTPRQGKYATMAETVSAYANYDVQRIPGVFRKVRKERTENHVYGTSIMKLYWDFDFYIEPGVNPETGKSEPFLNTTRDQFNFDTISCRNFFPDPMAKCLDDAKYIITRTLIDTDEFKQMIERLEYSKLKKEEVDSIAVAPNNAFSFVDQYSELDYKDSVTLDERRKFIEIIEYWSVPENRLVVVAGDKYIIRNDQNPFKHKKYPFIIGVDIPDPEYFWGISTVELIHDLQCELNSLRNHRMDKHNYVTNPMWKARESSIFDKRELVSRPGGVVKLKDMNDLDRIDMGTMNQGDYVEVQEVKQDIQSASSITDYAAGVPQGGGMNETATGISIISSNADAKIITKLQYSQEEQWKPFGYMWLQLQQQFGKTKEIFYVTGQELTYNKNMLFVPYELKILASTQLVNKTVRQNQMLQLSQMLFQDPTVNHAEFVKMLLEVFGIDANKLLVQGSPALPGAPLNFQAAGQPNPQAGLEAQQNMNVGASGYDFIQGKSV